MSITKEYIEKLPNNEGVDFGGASTGDYLDLLKPRVMSLVIFTCLVGMMLAPGSMNPVLAGLSLIAIAAGAGASGALNMWYDADIDQLMERTKDRPVAAGRVGKSEALGFGLTIAVASVVLLYFAANAVAALLLAFTIFFYAVVYSIWLKRSTDQNIVIGGAAGALPPVVGWSAVTGSIALEPLILFTIIFLWTPPHFWALAILKSDEYGRAGIPMLPNTQGVKVTRFQIFIYSLVLAPCGVLPFVMGFAGPVYGAVSFIGGLLFIAAAVRIWKASDDDALSVYCRHMFAYSILYLFVLFAVLLIGAVQEGLF